MCDVMLSQDCLYTLVERCLEGDQARIIGSWTDPAHQRVAEISRTANQVRVLRVMLAIGQYIHQRIAPLSFAVGETDRDFGIIHPQGTQPVLYLCTP